MLVFKEQCEAAERFLNDLKDENGKPKPEFLTREGFIKIEDARRILKEKSIAELGLSARRLIRNDYSYYKNCLLTEHNHSLITSDQSHINGKLMGFKDLIPKDYEGIREIDGALSKIVMAYLKRDPSYKKHEIRKMILGNPHIHDVVKANLLLNLKHR
jgi:hypothetical protein